MQRKPGVNIFCTFTRMTSLTPNSKICIEIQKKYAIKTRVMFWPEILKQHAFDIIMVSL